MAQRQFYIEEDFPSHPKVLKAGGDAAWLHVCALAWASKHMTGDIPKGAVPQLSDRKNPAGLAKKLVEVELWHDRGDYYEIHDWEIRNAKRMASRRKAKHAADVRWQNYDPDAEDAEGDVPEDAPSMPGAMPEACSTDALDPTNQRTHDGAVAHPERRRLVPTEPVCGSWRSGVVLDPFGGSGTTGVVATGHGRDAILIDIDARNAQLAMERVGPLLLTVEYPEEAA